MLKIWKRAIYHESSSRSIRWIFLVSAIVFFVQGIFFWQELPVIRTGVILLAAAHCAFFIADSLATEKALLRGAVRILGVACTLISILLIIVGLLARLNDSTVGAYQRQIVSRVNLVMVISKHPGDRKLIDELS